MCACVPSGDHHQQELFNVVNLLDNNAVFDKVNRTDHDKKERLIIPPLEFLGKNATFPQ